MRFKDYPSHIKSQLIFYTTAFIVCSLLLYSRYVLKLYIIDPFYFICGFIISLGMLCTVVSSMIDWKKWFEGEE